jgi:hypothetical protein
MSAESFGIPIDPYPEDWVRPPDPPCSGECLTANDIGLPEYGTMIAYPHPDCPRHGYLPREGGG